MIGGIRSRVISSGIQAAARQAHAQREGRGGRNRPAPVAPRRAENHGREPHHRAHRKVDAAGDHDRRQRQRQQPQFHAQADHFEEIPGREEILAQGREDGDLRRQRRTAGSIRRWETSARRQGLCSLSGSVACIAPLRRRRASIATAARMIAPCMRPLPLGADRPGKSGPARSSPAARPPAPCRATVPRPPVTAVPPTTTAAITFELQPDPRVARNLVETHRIEQRGETRSARRSAANTRNTTRAGSIPARRAAVSFDPVAYTARPAARFLRPHAIASAKSVRGCHRDPLAGGLRSARTTGSRAAGPAPTRPA